MNRWEYLTTKEFSIRHHITEYFIKDCDAVIDVGAYKKKLNTNGVLYTIDPLKTLEDSFHDSLYNWNIEYSEIFKYNNYAVVALGLDIEGDSNEIDTLIKLIQNSNVTIIEYATEYRNSINQYNYILKSLINKKESTTIHISLPKIITDGFKPFYKRVIHVLI